MTPSLSGMFRRTVPLLPGRFLSFGLVCGVAVTGVVTAWEWIENPAGLFRDASGTRWHFVRDTAVSWLVPTFLTAGGLGAAIHLALTGLGRLRGKARAGCARRQDGPR